ncbi:B12-binding domain-containing radical SAM protein [Gigaspora margarita]|uniref:B12-binding domain-containing radical SAM protein n=1 Tax=Gigaspora margarita TaxID=4874 RepID=A0A8H4ESZ5_GIGMA|nr:B12-binding domain-containing radical SAM protein [Gigaspora margarita]
MLILLSWVLARKPKVINPIIVENLASIKRSFNCLSGRKEFVPNREEFQTAGQKKLILISLDWTRPKDPPLSLGHASILACLRQHNIDVFPRSWSVNVPNFSPDDVVEFIMIHANPCIDVAIGAFVWNEKAVQHILRKLKKYKFPGKVILGGPQVSYVKKGVEEYYPYADIYIRGYAENALVKLMLSKKPFPCIKGVHYFGRPDLGLSAAAELDVLPSPFLTKLIPPQRLIRWETQRGCPFRCAFCQHRESDVTMKRRQFPISRIIQEAEWIAKYSNIQDVAVLVPTFNSGPYYLDIMDKLIEEKYRGKLSLQCRIEMVKEEFLNKVAQLNETAETVLEFGLQTTDPKEQAIIDRPNNMKIVEKVLAKIRERNIKIDVSLIFGLPGQTITTFKKSIDFCFDHKVPVIHAFPLMLLRGTPLHERKAELGLVESYEIASTEIDRVQTDIPHVVASPSFTYEEWKEMSKIAESLECSIKNISKSSKENHNAKQYFHYENINSSDNININ